MLEDEILVNGEELEIEEPAAEASPEETEETPHNSDTEELKRELEELKTRLFELERLDRIREEIEAQRQRIAECNETNRKMSTGSLSGVGNGGYYSPDEVRLMTPSQVRENYDDVIESMRHWN